METIIFNGRAFADEKEKELKKKVEKIKKKGITPKLVAIVIGNYPASEMYVNMKKRVAARVGCNLMIVKLSKNTSTMNNKLRLRVIRLIREINLDKSIHGIMLQLPLPENFSKEDRDKIIKSIAKEKDVDGMRDDSPYLSPVVKAVIYALKDASTMLPLRDNLCKVIVVGYTGFEGKKIHRTLKEMNYDVVGVDIKTPDLKVNTLSADILISVTGVRNLIEKSMVKKGCVLIDVGAPDGDIDRGAYEKASFVSPVPGGIGPVTIISLLENLVFK